MRYLEKNKLLKLLIAALLCLGLSPVLNAAKKPRVRAGVENAPNQNDFYSTVNPNVSEQDKRKANQIRLQTLDSIKKLLAQKNVKGSRRFELLLRQGELHAEGHDYIRDEESKNFELAQKSWINSGKKGKSPIPNYSKSKIQLANAADSFRKLVREFPREPRTAAALYSLGKTLSRLDDDGAIMYFEQLIKNHKSSPLVADTYLSMGEFYFDKHQIEKSIAAYKNFLKYKDHVSYPYGVYKLGWAYYNATPTNDQDAQDNVQKSVASFKLAIKLAEADKRRNIARLDLRQEAIRDLIMVWSETEDTDAAWAYFKTIGEKKSFYDMLERLGGMYADQGKNAKAADVYARLVSEAPLRDTTPKIYERLLALYDSQSQPQKLVDTLATMNKLFVEGSAWTEKFAKEGATVAEAKTSVEFNMHRYGTMYHQRAQKTSSKAGMASALQIYAMYLAAFPKAKSAYEVRYYYADVLFDMQRYESAADQYGLVAEADKTGKFMKESALNAVVAMNKVDQSANYAKLPPPGQVPKAIALPKTKVKLVSALDRYVALLPADKAGEPMRFTAAQTFFDYGNYDEATKRFSKIIEDVPGSKQADVSLKILLSYYAERKDLDKTVALAQDFLNSKKLTKEMRSFVTQTLRNGMFNQALELEKDQKYEASARSFLAFHKVFATDESVADKALFNASVNFYKAGLLEDAIAANARLIESHRGSSLAPQAILNVGQTYEALGQYDKAANYYRQYAMSYPKEKLASRATYNAAVLFAGLNQTSEAERLYTRFIQLYPYNDQLDVVRLELASIQEENGEARAAIGTYRDLSSAKNRDLALLGMAKAAVLSMQMGQAADGRKMLQAAMQQLRAKDAPSAYEARRVVAEALFLESEATFANVRQMPINSAKSLESDVLKKQRNLVLLAKRYEDVMSLENAEFAVASLYRLGELHEDMAEKLFAVQSPDGGSQVDASKFKTSIEKIAIPLRDEAYKFYETAFKRCQDVETFSTWTQRTYDKMAELAPSKNPAVLELAAQPLYMDHKIPMEKEVASLAH